MSAIEHAAGLNQNAPSPHESHQLPSRLNQSTPTTAESSGAEYIATSDGTHCTATPPSPIQAKRGASAGRMIVKPAGRYRSATSAGRPKAASSSRVSAESASGSLQVGPYGCKFGTKSPRFRSFGEWHLATFAGIVTPEDLASETVLVEGSKVPAACDDLDDSEERVESPPRLLRGRCRE